jgi:N-acetylglucosamine malate deacetylase 1
MMAAGAPDAIGAAGAGRGRRGGSRSAWAAPPTLRRLAERAIVHSVNRLRPLTPPTVWFAASALGSALGQGPAVTRPCGARALVLAPHPDDETIGCGGAVALLASSGTDVRVVALSSGERIPSWRVPMGRGRAEELRQACAVLGATLEKAHDFPDGELSRHHDDLAGVIGETIIGFQPELVFVPWLGDRHADHRAVARALAECDTVPRTCEIWCYEVWEALAPNRLVDVSPWWSVKERALACHVSGFRGFDLSAHLALGRWRSVAGLGGAGYAEAYQVMSAADLRRCSQAL